LAGRIEVGTTKALLAQWERKEKSRLSEKPTFVEKPVVVEKSLPQPRSFVVEKSLPQSRSFVVEKSLPQSRSFVVEKAGFDERPSGGGGVKTLGLDINSFVPVCFFEIFLSYLSSCLFVSSIAPIRMPKNMVFQ